MGWGLAIPSFDRHKMLRSFQRRSCILYFETASLSGYEYKQAIRKLEIKSPYTLLK